MQGAKAMWKHLCAMFFLAFTFLSGQVFSQAVVFKDVKMYNRTSMESKPTKRDVYLNLDRTGKALVAVADNRVQLTIPYAWVSSITYEHKNDHLLTIQYKGSQDSGLFAQFELNGGNRDQILAAIEADTGVKVSRVGS
jgi:hypothetical protein